MKTVMRFCGRHAKLLNGEVGGAHIYH